MLRRTVTFSVGGVPRGLSARPGQLVAMDGGSAAPTDARCFGYLTSDSLSGYSATAVLPSLDYEPRPSAFLAIDASVPVVVPPGKVFVLTAMGFQSNPPPSGGAASFTVNGVTEFTVFVFSGGGYAPGTSVSSAPTGITAPAGSSIMITALPAAGTTAVAWGYFADV